MLVRNVTLSEARELAAGYLVREARENAIAQGYRDPFPDDNPLMPSPEERAEPSDEARLRWWAAVATRDDDRFDGEPYDGDDPPRLVERFGKGFVTCVSHVSPVGGYKDLLGEWRFGRINGASKLFWSVVDGSALWTTVFGAVRNWYDVLDWELTPRGKGVWVYLTLDILSSKERELVEYALPAVKAIRVCVHGDIVERVKDILGV